MPRGILKTASSRDKALPEIPSSPALVKMNTKRNAFRHGNDLVSLSSSTVHPKQRSTQDHGGRYGVNDSEDDIPWALKNRMEPVHTTKEGRNTKRQQSPRSNRMRGKRYHSSKSSRASSVEKRPRTHPRRKRGTSGYGSSVSSTAASRNSSLQSNLGYPVHLAAPRRHVEELKPVKGLRLSKRKAPINIAAASPKSSQILQKNLGTSPRQKNCVGSSPLLVSSTKSSLRRRPRVDKRGSMSETDPGHDDLSAFLPTINPPFVYHKRPATQNSDSNYHPIGPDATPRVGKQSYRRRSNAHKQVNSPITIHSLPLILPANAEYKCRIEWEADKDAQSDNDEACNLWKRLEQECGISPTPPSIGHGLIHANATVDDVELTPRRGRWKVKVVETPTIPTVPAESSPRIGINSSPSDNKWTDEDLQFTESAMGIDDNSVPILREVSITELLPSLSAYTYLSSLLNKRTSSRHRRRARSRRSWTLRLTRSKTRLSRAEKSGNGVHTDVKRALCGFWEDCEDGRLDEDQMEGAVWSSHMAMLMRSTRSRSILKSRMGRVLSGKGLDRGMSTWDRSSMNQEEGVAGLGIAMHHSATLKSRDTTMGADSVIDFYADT